MTDDELVEMILEHGPPYSAEERLFIAVFGKRFTDWEGVAIPKLEVFKKYLRGVELFKKLFGNSERYEINFDTPEPFKDYCGMYVYILASDSRGVVASFQDKETMEVVRELVNLVDNVTIEAEVLLNPKVPRLCIACYFNDPFFGKPNTD